MTGDLHLLGRITKAHGYNGTVVLVSDQPLDDNVEQLDEIFVVIDGLQVPFPVDEIELLTDTSAHVQLEFVSNRDEALELVGHEAYTAIATYVQKIETDCEKWTGFTVHDTKCGKIGTIQQIEDYKGNIVMQVMDGDKETLISLFPELVTQIDQNAKILQITAPDGYF